MAHTKCDRKSDGVGSLMKMADFEVTVSSLPPHFTRAAMVMEVQGWHPTFDMTLQALETLAAGGAEDVLGIDCVGNIMVELTDRHEDRYHEVGPMFLSLVVQALMVHEASNDMFDICTAVRLCAKMVTMGIPRDLWSTPNALQGLHWIATQSPEAVQAGYPAGFPGDMELLFP
jgi:hypothetical protein